MLWIWMTEYPDGSIGSIAAGIPGLGMSTLSARREDVARKLQPFAQRHKRATGQRVWLRRYESYTDLEEI